MTGVIGKIAELDGITRVHLMGIGGAGMAALAKLLSGLGYQVTGCDLAHASPAIKELESLGITCLSEHSAEHIETFKPQLVIYSSAIAPDCPELVTAQARKIQTVGRGQALSWLFNAAFGIGIAGAHGKTTTSSMLAFILTRADRSPTCYIGGQMRDLGTNAILGEGKFFVSELDESDGSFEFFHPALSIVTNADWDHVNHFATRQDVIDAFTRFVNGRKPDAPVVICAEDEGAQAVIAKLDAPNNLVRYGWGNSWEWGAYDLYPHKGGGISFRVSHGGAELGSVNLLVSGEHNVLNALAAITAAYLSGISFDQAARILGEFHGAARRLQVKGSRTLTGALTGGITGDVIVLDDYAHHPTEVAATLSAVRGIYPDRRLVVVFQPHRYTRTAMFLEPLAAALSVADRVLLLPVYSAGEHEIPVSLEQVVDRVRSTGDNKSCTLCPDADVALRELQTDVREGDLILTMGAGDVYKIGERFLAHSDI